MVQDRIVEEEKRFENARKSPPATEITNCVDFQGDVPTVGTLVLSLGN